jgi:hypothetical protein
LSLLSPLSSFITVVIIVLLEEGCSPTVCMLTTIIFSEL